MATLASNNTIQSQDQIAAMGGDASAFVPPHVAAALAARFPRR